MRSYNNMVFLSIASEEASAWCMKSYNHSEWDGDRRKEMAYLWRPFRDKHSCVEREHDGHYCMRNDMLILT